MEEKLTEIEKKLAAIESLLQRLPEIQAAVMIQMWEEYQEAQLTGRKASDSWVICPPDQR